MLYESDCKVMFEHKFKCNVFLLYHKKDWQIQYLESQTLHESKNYHFYVTISNNYARNLFLATAFPEPFWGSC